jgi:hypothetical protein
MAMRHGTLSLLVALILQPLATVVCQARCVQSLPASTSATASHCHQPSGSSETLTSAPAEACAHPAPVDPTVRSTALPVAGPPVARFTIAHATTLPANAAAPTIPRTSHRAPDDSSGTLRV